MYNPFNHPKWMLRCR